MECIKGQMLKTAKRQRQREHPVHFIVCVPHPELRELVIDVLSHQRQMEQVKCCLLWSRYPEGKQKSTVHKRNKEENVEIKKSLTSTIRTTSSVISFLQSGPPLWAGRSLARGWLNPTLSTHTHTHRTRQCEHIKMAMMCILIKDH